VPLDSSRLRPRTTNEGAQSNFLVVETNGVPTTAGKGGLPGARGPPTPPEAGRAPASLTATSVPVTVSPPLTILIQRENPAIYYGRESRPLRVTDHRSLPGRNPNG
jgi:hypothetical protein